MSLSQGTRFGSYEIGDAIGAGGMGVVHRATDTVLKRDVAIKALPESFAEDAERLARFRREAEVLASLNHANIAQIYGLEKADGRTVIVMELVEGPTLADRIAEGPIRPEEALGIARQIADALEAAHSAQVVHRDLKPANIKLRPDGTVKVLDFGIAKALEARAISGGRSAMMTTPAVTETGMILGTAAYMSPEQARGRFVDQRTDIWAFGCLLFEMLTGQPAFGGEDVMLTLARVLDRDTDLSSIPGTISPAVRHTLKLCLEKDPSQRIADIRDVRLALAGKFETDLPRAKELRSAPAWRWIAAIVLTAAVIGTAAWTLKPGAERPVIRLAHVLPPDEQFLSLGRTVGAISPDGSHIVYSANGQLYLRAMDALTSSPISGTNQFPTSPFFSPDGQWVGFYSTDDNQLKKISIAGGASVTLTTAGNPFGRPIWDRDNNIIWAQNEGVMSVSGNGGVAEILVPNEAGALILAPQLLPDGSTLLFGFGGAGSGDIAVQSLETGERKTLFPGVFPRFLSTGHIVYGTNDVLFSVPFDAGAQSVVGGPVPMVEGVMSQPLQYDVSDSGTLLWVPSGALGVTEQERVLAIVDREGKVDRLDLPPARYQSPRISPDGMRLAVEIAGADGQSNIWIHDLTGRVQMRQLTRGGNNTRPIWTPDGNRITFASDRDGYGAWWQNADFSGVAERLTTGDVEHWPASWDPSGKILAITTSIPGGGGAALGISTFNRDTGELTEFYDLPDGNQESAAFSPDGKWLAYSSFEPGNQSMQVYVQPFPPTGEIHPITTSGEGHPVWSHDGTELFFRRSVAAQPEPAISTVKIATAPAVTWGAQQTLPIENFSIQASERSFDIMPDGQHFLVALPASETTDEGPRQQQINVVVNWIEELEQRVPGP